MFNNSVEATDTEISPAITIPLSKTRSKISAKDEDWLAVGILRWMERWAGDDEFMA
jgi:hypothetical protein